MARNSGPTLDEHINGARDSAYYVKTETTRLMREFENIAKAPVPGNSFADDFKAFFSRLRIVRTHLNSLNESIKVIGNLIETTTLTESGRLTVLLLLREWRMLAKNVAEGEEGQLSLQSMEANAFKSATEVLKGRDD